MELDRYDRRLLEELQKDGRISSQELAERIGFFPSPCLRRVRTLEESGLIRDSHGSTRASWACR